jgi:hypothetical protein
MLQINGSAPGRSFIDAFTYVDRDARHNASRYACPFAFDQPVNVTTQQTNDLRVPAHDVGQRNDLLGPAVAADVMVIDIKWGMMNKQQCRLAWLIAKHRVEPSLARRTKHALALIDTGRVECDQAQVVVLDDVMQKVATCRQMRVIPERVTQYIIVVAIAWNQVERRIQWLQQLTQVSVFFRPAMLYRVTGENDGIGSLQVDIRDTTPKAVGPQRSYGLVRCRWQDVGIADLGYMQCAPLIDDVINGSFLHFPVPGVLVVLGQGEAMPVADIDAEISAKGLLVNIKSPQ